MLNNPEVGDFVKANDYACKNCLTCKADILIVTEVGEVGEYIVGHSVSVMVIDPITRQTNAYWSYKLDPVGENAVNSGEGEW